MIFFLQLTAALSTAAGQTSSVQTRTKESKPSSSKGARKPSSTQSVQNTAPTPVPAPASVPYPQGISSTSQQLSRPLTHTTTESSLDSRLQYMNPVNPSFPNNSNPVPAPQYPGSVPNTQYPGYSFYEGQYQPQAPEGYQWGYSAVNQGEAPPPLPPSEDLPKPPPENQTYWFQNDCGYSTQQCFHMCMYIDMQIPVIRQQYILMVGENSKFLTGWFILCQCFDYH